MSFIGDMASVHLAGLKEGCTGGEPGLFLHLMVNLTDFPFTVRLLELVVNSNYKKTELFKLKFSNISFLRS